jgi:uncharacterized membrane protein YbhN (UPF0104 family)
VETVKILDLRYAPIIVLLLVLNYVVGAFRWKSLLVHKNSERADVKYLINLYFIGAFFNNFMPTTIGGDVYKVYKLGKKIDSTVDSFSATFMERFTGVIALVLISVVSLVNLLGLWGVLLLAGFLIGMVAGFLFLGFLANRFSKLKKVYDSIYLYKNHKRVIFWAFVTSFLIQLFAIFTQYFIFMALGIKLPLVYSLFIFPVITLASFFIPSLNGIGVQDALYMRFFLAVGVAEPVSLSASLVYHLFRLGVSLFGGVLYGLAKDD